ncbi:hypothetical protein DXX92_06805 [Thalassotalea euphylliae]|uniref:Uncharacterized protein n=1 Tax=Thalassotalea euphylliae TaxID=1655234 RepID=A0A3E0UDY5_9GAMM|nr:hypothetical protein DXX92_06805 [Thalassotalea euphylliae]
MFELREKFAVRYPFRHINMIYKSFCQIAMWLGKLKPIKWVEQQSDNISIALHSFWNNEIY